MTAPDLRALAEAATPGPWGRCTESIDCVKATNGTPVARVRTAAGQYELDAAYIAAASPDVILALLDEIDSLRDVIETALQNTLTVMADDMRLRDADVILQRNTGSGRVA